MTSGNITDRAAGPGADAALVAFDGDDTLWHTESIFARTQATFGDLLADYGVGADLQDRLYATERRNLALFGYGIKGFTLSMIETAIEITRGAVTAAGIREILDLGKAMLDHPVVLIDGVAEVLTQLQGRCRLGLITKGDLFDQESKVARSGLAGHFERIDIVSEKDPATYRGILAAAGVPARSFVMIGNSLRSDILPVLDLGAHAVHIPYSVTWAHEVAHRPDGAPDTFHEAVAIAEVPALLERLHLLSA